MLSEKEFKNLAFLARLDPEDESLLGLRDNFNQILEFVEKIQTLEIKELDEFYTSMDIHNVMREDAAKKTLDGSQIAEIAPEWEAGHFVVPRVIDAE